MKRACKTLVILFLLCGGAFAQERVETNDVEETASNSNSVLTAPPAPAAPPTLTQRAARIRADEERITREVAPPQVIVRPLLNGREIENILVPIVCVVVVFGTIVLVCALFFAFLHRRQRMLHETVRMMVEKGVAIPPELLAKPERKEPVRMRNDTRRGWILVGVGVGMLCLVLFGGRHGPPTLGVLGFIPLFLGLAFLMISRAERKNKETIGS